MASNRRITGNEPMGGVPAHGVLGRVEALGGEIDQKLSKYDAPQTFAPELEAAADAALARLAGTAGVSRWQDQTVPPSTTDGAPK